MSRRSGVPWAPTSVPTIRRLWCDALDGVIERSSAGMITEPGAASTRDGVRLRRMQAKIADTVEVMKTETEAVRGAEMYWVAREMVSVALDASATLPEWTPAAAMPCPNGLLCWAKPAGMIPFGPPSTSTVEVPWDGVWWWTRPDGALQVSSASRFHGRSALLEPFEVSTPLWAAHTIVADPQRPRTEEANGAMDMHPFVSVLGAAWLLMGQPGITETRSIQDRAAPRPSKGGGRPPVLLVTPPVTIVELRRAVRPPHDSEPEESQRRFRRRWWVGGHWRQQACGPNLSQRRPTWVAPHVKGPADKPLTTDKVYLWRR